MRRLSEDLCLILKELYIQVYFHSIENRNFKKEVGETLPDAGDQFVTHSLGILLVTFELLLESLVLE